MIFTFTGRKQKWLKTIIYVLDASIGQRGIKEKPSFITSLVGHTVTLENVPRQLTG